MYNVIIIMRLILFTQQELVWVGYGGLFTISELIISGWFINFSEEIICREAGRRANSKFLLELPPMKREIENRVIC
jgi:hypothetical protein